MKLQWSVCYWSVIGLRLHDSNGCKSITSLDSAHNVGMYFPRIASTIETNQ